MRIVRDEPITLLVLAGPAVFLAMSRANTSEDPSVRWIASGMTGLFGLILGLVAVVGVASALPRRVTLDWPANTLERRGLLRSASHALSDLRELELKCVRTYRSGGKNSPSYHSYRCEVIGHLRQGAGASQEPPVLIATNEFQEDPATPYRLGLPLATELSAALNVPRKVTEFS